MEFARSSDGGRRQVTVDATPTYLWDYDGWWRIAANAGAMAPRHTMADALRRVIPSAKVIAILRDPAQRCLYRRAL
jgi:hypothetical protein